MSIRFTEAIRLGITLGPQAFDTYRDGDATCAIGAAFLAAGRLDMFADGTRDSDAIPSLSETLTGKERFRLLTSCGVTQACRANDIQDAVIALNDIGKWTRDEIADWLDHNGRDCEMVTVAPAQEIAAALVSAHMVAK